MLFAQAADVAVAVVPLTFWERVLDKYGLPTVYLALTLYVIIAAAKWLRDKVATPMIDSHKELCANLSANNTENASNLKTATKAIDMLATTQKEIVTTVKDNGIDTVKAIESQTESLLSRLNGHDQGVKNAGSKST